VTTTTVLRLKDLLDGAKLTDYCNQHLVNIQHHPALPLAIYNYGRKAVFDCVWDEITEQCRGLIVDQSTDEVLARPFRKFFNYETGYRPETQAVNLPTSEPEITEKLDGSLGILYRYKSFVGIATKGSFASDQATWASAWYGKNLGHARWPDGWTPLFEIIYPDNRVVVKYDHEGLTLLGMVHIQTGEEIPYSALRYWGNHNSCPVVKLHNKTLADCRAENIPNSEGYVATWLRAGQPPVKIKVKFQDYFRLHHLLTGISPKEIWTQLKDGLSIDYMTEDVPSHFADWVNGWKGSLQAEYGRIEQKAKGIWANCPLPKDGTDKAARKALAEFFTLGDRREVSGILFKMLDRQSYEEVIWKLLRPMTAGLDPFKAVDE
jgi:RNA ligase